jgi:hypothetical protein
MLTILLFIQASYYLSTPEKILKYEVPHPAPTLPCKTNETTQQNEAIPVT